MKTTGILIIAAVAILSFAFVTSGCKQDIIDKSNQLDADLKMYETAWDDVMDRGEIKHIDTDHFTKDLNSISDPEKVVGTAVFKAYYKNYFNEFLDIDFTVENVFGQEEDSITNNYGFQDNHKGNSVDILPTHKMVDTEGATLLKTRDGKKVLE